MAESAEMTVLERTTYVCLIAVSLLAIGLLVEKRFTRMGSTHLPDARSIEGQAVKLPGVNWRGASLNVVLQIGSKCHFCAESVPLYQQVAALPRSGRSLIVASPDATGEMETYLAEHQIAVDQIVNSPLEPAVFTGTPAVYLINSSGIVRKAFIGKLEGSAERKLLALMRDDN